MKFIDREEMDSITGRNSRNYHINSNNNTKNNTNNNNNNTNNINNK